MATKTKTETRTMRLAAPFNMEVLPHDDGTFTLAWVEGEWEGNVFKQRRVAVVLKDWWIPNIADGLRKVVKDRTDRVQRLVAAIGETQP
jgi:hypothetical protein